MFTKVLAVIIGCLSICVGVAIFIVADIGVDPLTGLTLWLGDKLKWEYRKTKVGFDICLTIAGFAMGGKLGAITLIVTLLGGPIIQCFVDILKKVYDRIKRNEVVVQGTL